MTTSTWADLIEGRFLEEEHRRVRVGLGSLQDAIVAAHEMSRSDAADRVAKTLVWLRRDVLAHAAWEEAWLYPRIDHEAHTPWATRSLRLEHDQIREVAGHLEAALQGIHDRWNAELAFRITAALARLEALVSAHLAQEERFVLPLLSTAAESATGEIEGADVVHSA